MIETDDTAIASPIRRIDLDRLQAIRELEIAVSLPPLNVRAPGDQDVPIPEPDCLAIPARHVLAKARHSPFHREVTPDVNVGDEIVCIAGKELDDRRRDDDRVRLIRDAVVVPATHEPFRPAILGRPHRGIRVAVMISLLDHSCLILLRQQGEDGRHLVP